MFCFLLLLLLSSSSLLLLLLLSLLSLLLLLLLLLCRDTAKDFLKRIKHNLSIKNLLELAANTTRDYLKPKLDKIIEDVKNITKLPKTFKGIESLSVGGLTRLWKKVSGKDLSLPRFDADGDSPLSILGSLGNSLIEELQGFVDNTTVGDLGNLSRLLDRLAGGKGSLISRLKQTIRESRWCMDGWMDGYWMMDGWMEKRTNECMK